MENPPPSRPISPQDEHIMAALAHITVLLPMLGIIAPIVIWVTQRDKSHYIAFQSLQALEFQLTFLALWIAGFACYIGTFFLVFFGSFVTAGILRETNFAPAIGGMFILPFIVIFLMLLLWIVMNIYGIVAAVMTFQGKDFRYVVIGRWVENYTQRSAAQ